MSGLAWFAAFWGFLVVLGLIEFAIDREGRSQPDRPDRRRRWPVNLGFGLINGTIFAIAPVGLVAVAGLAQGGGLGLLNTVAAPLWLAILVTALGRNLAQYWFHRLVHAVPALWQVHHVHHCDRHVDGTTGLRFHPVEYVANLAFVAPFVLVLGLDPTVLAAWEVAEALVGIAGHTSARLPPRLDRAVRLVLVTPGMHRLHHSEVIRESNSNYATVFSIWDRLFGTYLADSTRDPAAFRYGVRGSDPAEEAGLERLLVLPLRRWRDGRRRPATGRPAADPAPAAGTAPEMRDSVQPTAMPPA